MTSPLPVSVPVEGRPQPVDLHLPATGRGPGLLLFQEIFGVTAYVTSRARDLAGLGSPCSSPDDSYIPADVVRRIETAVTAGGADTTFLTYAGAGHAFDNPSPAFHHADAARQAWAATEAWLADRLPATAGGG